MIRDLKAVSGSSNTAQADVLIIGAGIAGLLLATRLSAVGRRVLVAESGGRAQVGETHPLNRVEQRGDEYLGAEQGRFRCLGGTSTRWGGAMLPFQASDLTLATHPVSPQWPIDIAELTAYQGEVETLFRLGDGAYDYPDEMGSGKNPPPFIGRLAKWPPFRLRNVATLLTAEIESARGPEIWLNAVATDFSFGDGGRLSSVRLRSDNGATLEVTARETVIAAGAIESTRLLLLADRQNDDRIFAPDDVLGRYFYDHLSLATAKITDFKRRALNRLAGWRFEGGMMRSLRFEPSAALRAEHRVPPGFVHIKFFSERPGGFLVLRDIYRKLQKRERPGVGDAASLLLAFPWLVRAAWWRVVERRLLFADDGELEIHVVIEQEPHADNRIFLSGTERDPFGAPLATIDWRVRNQDAAMMIATTNEFAAAWEGGALARLGRLQVQFPADVREALAVGGGVYHPGGSIRMGKSAADSVLDGNLATHRVPNLSVVATAAFPTGGGANPTMMLMMAALRAADRLKRLAW